MDSKVFKFASSKEESLFLQRKNPRKLAWTQIYRRVNKKGVSEEVAKKRSRRTVKHQRGFVGLDLEALKQKRSESAGNGGEGTCRGRDGGGDDLPSPFLSSSPHATHIDSPEVRPY